MRKNRCTRVFAWLLSVIMIFSMMPVAVLAEEPAKGIPDNNESLPKTEDTVQGTLPYILLPGTSPDETNNGASGGSSSDVGFKASLEYIREEDSKPVSMKEGDPDPNKDYFIRITFDSNGLSASEIFDFGFALDYVRITETPDPNGPYTYNCVDDGDNKNIEIHWQSTTDRSSFVLDIPIKPAFPEPEGWNFNGKEYAIVAKASNAMMVPEQRTQNNKPARNVIRSASCTLLNGKVRNNENPQSNSFWKFNHVSGSWYSISCENKIICFDSTNGMLLADESVAVQVKKYS